MLQTLRDKTSGWIATVILGLLIIPFAFVGIEQYMVQRTDNAVARIDIAPTWWPDAPSWWPVSVFWTHETISAEDFRERLEDERARLIQQQGEAFDPREFDTVENKRRVLEALIDQRVVGIAGRRAGLAVSDERVRETIASIPQFQVNGAFDRNQYLLALQGGNPPRTPAQFEARVREDLQRLMLASQLGASEFATGAEYARLVALLGEKRDVSLVALPAPPADTAPVTDAEAEAWFKGNAATYRQPQRVWLEYVELKADDLPAPAVDEATLRARYEQEKARFAGDEQRRASHILVTVPADATPAQQKAAEEKIRRVAAEARAPGADFAALARTYSDDPTRDNGGDLDWLSRGATPAPEFERALFALQPGQVSEPVKTQYGWHVIQLREVQGGQQRAFEDVREQLASEVATAERERAFSDASSKLVDAAYKNPSSLAPAARELGLPLRTLGPVSRESADAILTTPAVRRAAFLDSAIQDKTSSEPIEIAPNHIVLLRVTRDEPERQRTLAEVRAQVDAAVRADRMRKVAERDADA
ncbi:peptidylprolyl isomerase, partial [Tolypothrix campylonemoides VB511288]